ncbi:MAG: hypothetical protein AVDCRST_MAG30-3726, partial [uncultured Solirubrobacteraceae bacterium]
APRHPSRNHPAAPGAARRSARPPGPRVRRRPRPRRGRPSPGHLAPSAPALLRGAGGRLVPLLPRAHPHGARRRAAARLRPDGPRGRRPRRLPAAGAVRQGVRPAPWCRPLAVPRPAPPGGRGL